MPLIVVGDVATHLTEVLVGTAGSGLHVVDLVAEVKVFKALCSQLIAVILVPRQDIGVSVSTEFMHLVCDVGEDVGSVSGELPILNLVILRLLKSLSKLRIFDLQVLGIS